MQIYFNPSYNPDYKRSPISFTSKDVILLIGAPNSGKGTFGRIISEKLSIPYIGSGNVIREETKKGNHFQEQAQKLIERFGVVPKYTQMVKLFLIETIKKQIAEPAYKKGFVLEGFPRSIKEAEQLKEVLKAHKDAKLKVIHLEVDKPILYERCAKRYICEDCYRTYSIDGKPQRCKCGGKLIKREDDTPEILSRRIEKYEKETLPLLKYYGDKVIDIEVHDKNTPISDTFEKIIDKL